MGANQAKKHFQKAVETDDLEYATKVLKQFPALLNEPLYPASLVSPLARATWRGCLDLVMLFSEAGANPDGVDKEGLTPLMWAAKRDHSSICVVLLRFNANPNLRSREGLSAIDYAILHGNYESAYIIFEFNKHIQEIMSYETIRLMKQWRYVDLEMLIESLQKSISPQDVGNLYQKPPNRVFQDPVIDPRETWKQMIKRIMNFEPPPLCERNELPRELQPQNRFLGRLSSYVNGLDPNPIDQSYELHQIAYTNDDQIQQQQQ